MESALHIKPLDVKEQCERQIHELQEACGEAMARMRVLKKYQILPRDDNN